MLARIYKPAKTAMQSGVANTRVWLLDFEAEAARRIDPVMGWTSGSDMDASELRLTFETKEAAIAFAEKHGIPYQVFDAPPARPVVKAYSDNFAYRRRKPWTH
ncbi:MAG: ETC complex I subunit [Alphaproteobacteria bacterium]|nr:ETC complex I subunit [Alphaproteobacteria bacterium]